MRFDRGSTSTAASSEAWRVISRSQASESFHGRTSVSSTRCLGTPPDEGTLAGASSGPQSSGREL